jgi:hypothetical protein
MQIVSVASGGTQSLAASTVSSGLATRNFYSQFTKLQRWTVNPLSGWFWSNLGTSVCMYPSNGFVSGSNVATSTGACSTFYSFVLTSGLQLVLKGNPTKCMDSAPGWPVLADCTNPPVPSQQFFTIGMMKNAFLSLHTVASKIQ